MDRAVRHPVAGAEAVRLQAAVDPRGALHGDDDVAQGDVLRPPGQQIAAVGPAQRVNDPMLPQTAGDAAEDAGWYSHAAADLGAARRPADRRKVERHPYGIIGRCVQLHCVRTSFLIDT